ncbi:MAG: hypothetical protein R3E12_13020 [Candidatus Eisenbacteria bacterium]
MNNRIRTGLISIAAGLALATVARAQSDAEAKSLTGVSEVLLVLRAVDASAGEPAVPVESFRDDIVALLDQGGVTVLSEEDLVGHPAAASLVLTVRSEPVVKNRIYSIELRVKQLATLVRDPEIQAPVTTWFGGDLGLSPASDFGEIREAMKALVVRFVTARHQVNPD